MLGEEQLAHKLVSRLDVKIVFMTSSCCQFDCVKKPDVHVHARLLSCFMCSVTLSKSPGFNVTC